MMIKVWSIQKMQSYKQQTRLSPIHVYQSAIALECYMYIVNN